MFTFDFLITVLVIYGIAKMVGIIKGPKATIGARPQPSMNKPAQKTELHVPPTQGKIVDASFEEIE